MKHISEIRNIANYALCIFVPFLMIIVAILILLVPQELFKKIAKNLENSETNDRLDNMRPHIKPGFSILDVGAGSGIFSKRVSEEFNANVIGVDIIDYKDEDIDVHLFDGKKIPFDDNSFDIVFAAFVLHHDKRHAPLLKEMRRVSRKTIIVYEDTYFTFLQRLFVCFNDFFANMIIGSIKALKRKGRLSIIKMPMPFTFRSINGWCDFFEAADLKVESIEVRHMSLRPLSKSCFILSKNLNACERGDRKSSEGERWR